jgi:hypothetical protein
MLKYDYKKRLTIEEIKAHPWMQGETASLQEVQAEINKRKKTIKTRLNDDPSGSRDTLDSEGYQTIYDDATKRSNETNGGPIDLDRERKIKIYNPDHALNTEFFSHFLPRTLLGALISYTNQQTLKMEVSQNTYKVTMTVSSENGNQFTFIAQILKVIPKEKLDAVRSTFADGDDSSDSDGLYENPTTDKDEEIKEKGEEID